MRNLNEKNYCQKLLICIVGSIVLAILGSMCFLDYETFEFGIILEVVAGIIFLLSFAYLIAKEFEFIAEEKGFDGKKYFWYSFVLGPIGYLLVIALPTKIANNKCCDDELPEL